MPTVAILSPAPASFVTTANQASFAVSGALLGGHADGVDHRSGDGDTDVLSGGLEHDDRPDGRARQGSITLSADHSDAAGNAATQASEPSSRTRRPRRRGHDDGTGADVDHQISTSTLSANWTDFVDGESGVVY